VRYVFTDYDEFADAISGLDGRYIPTARSRHQWWIDPARVGRLRLQQLQVGAPAAFAGDGEESEAGVTVGIPLTDPAEIRIDGHSLAEDSFILIRQDRPLTYSAQGITRWAGVTIPTNVFEHARFKDAAEWSAAMLSETRVRANASALRRVSLLVALLCAGEDSINIFNPAAIAAAEEEFLVAVSELLQASTCFPEQRVGRKPLARDRIIARCLEFLSENHGGPILVGDLCRAADVTERTLRNVFNEYFGVGPIRFLRARQLQEIRSALLTQHSANETISQVAARFGVWDFNLFSRNYRALYGESPSQTLRNSRSGRPQPAMSEDLESMRSWMRYANARFAGIGDTGGGSP
jgi:AraC family ethanolamine operon transcriptional activator